MNGGNLMAGKRGLVMGVANEKSIAWGIAAAAAEQGAEIAFSYQMAGFKKRLVPLASSIGSRIMIECDVAQPGAVESCFGTLAEEWPKIDFVVHALAFSDKAELKGAYLRNEPRKLCQHNDDFCLQLYRSGSCRTEYNAGWWCVGNPQLFGCPAKHTKLQCHGCCQSSA